MKPANLLVTPDRRVKVTDFGIARAADDAQITRTGAVMGTPQYLSPEQARGNPSTPASDVYSLGVVAFECLTGRRPFEADTPVATALAHIQQPIPDLPEDIPEDLRTIVRRALAKDPAERYADGAALAAALRGAEVAPAAAARPLRRRAAVLPATPADPSPPAPRLCRPRPRDSPTAREEEARNVLPIVLIVLLLVAAAIAAGVLLFGGTTTSRPATTADRPATSRPPTPSRATRAPTTPTTTAAETVTVDADDYVGRDRFEVEAELQRIGPGRPALRGRQPGRRGPDTVASLSPTGELLVGDPIDLHYWGPDADTTADHRDDRPPTETTERTETATDRVDDGR